MDKFILIFLLLTISILIGAGCSAQRNLAWEDGHLVLNNKILTDPYKDVSYNLLKLHLDGTLDKNIIIKLNNNPTSRDFALKMPMNLTFQKYSDYEIISYLNDKLLVDSSYFGMTPQKGDLCYYAPWGNIIFFQQDGNYTQGLIKIGHIQEGYEYLNTLSDTKSVSIDFTD